MGILGFTLTHGIGIGLFIPVLGFTIIEILNLLKLKKCGFLSTMIPKQQADQFTCEEDQIYVIDEALKILNDPLTTVDCVADTISVLNNKYKFNLIDSQLRLETQIDIGDWDMNALKTINVPHGLADITGIVSVSVIIRDDNGVETDSYFYIEEEGIWTGTDATNITLDITGIVKFDGVDYNLTPLNRGYLTIIYKP